MRSNADQTKFSEIPMTLRSSVRFAALLFALMTPSLLHAQEPNPTTVAPGATKAGRRNQVIAVYA